MKNHQLIGAPVSLYTGKLRCYLKYKAIPYDEVLATAAVYRDVIIPRTGVQFIPILITDNDIALQDTTEIIDFLEARYIDASIYPSGPCQKLIALLLEIYADEWLVIPAMHYRWNMPENREFAIQEFGRTTAPDAEAGKQQALGEQAAKPFAGALPRLGITAKNAAAIEKSYLALLHDLNLHFSQHPFLLGTKPCIGDFGLIGPLYAHLYRDPASGQVMQERAPNVVSWVRRMIDPQPKTGAFIGNDQVPETLWPVIARMVSEQGPVLQQTIQQVTAWAESNNENELPRAIGKLLFSVEGVEEERLTFPYMQWMWQRAYDFYQGLEGADKADVDRLLKSMDIDAGYLDYPVKNRLQRYQNKLLLQR